MADDARVLEQPLDISLVKVGDAVEIETVKGGAEILPLGEDRPPAQPGLKPFQTQFFEQTAVVRHRKTPLVVVVGEELRRRSAPAAAGLAVGSGNRGWHGGVLYAWGL
ncbi:MAG: hypothetical protein AMXMBFR26_09980 [Porticoccaceae bacterium]